MEPNVSVKDLTTTSTSPIIMCRVVKQWDIVVYSTKSCRTMRFLLVDCEGNAIEAELLKADQRLLPVKPVDGEVYVFKQFRVNDAKDEYNATSHKFIIRFHKFTQVIRVKNIDRHIPLHYFDFKDFSEIGVSLRRQKTVIDVIGHLSAIGDVLPVPSVDGVYTKAILLSNQTNETIRITLWSEYMDLINDDAVKEISKTKAVVIAFSSLELKHFGGIYFLKTFSATKIYMDHSIACISAYIQTINDGAYPIGFLEPIEIQSSRTSKLTVPIAMTLQEMTELEPYSSSDQQYMCEATISEILSKDSWCYTACLDCKTTLASMDCDRCHIVNAASTQWYRVVVRVTAGLASAVFVLMGKQAEQVIGLKANLLLDEAHRTSRMLPAQLMNIIGRRFRFVVQINFTQFFKNKLSFDVNQVHELERTEEAGTSGQIRRDKRAIEHDSAHSSLNPTDMHTGLSPMAANISLGNTTTHTNMKEQESAHSNPAKKYRTQPVKQEKTHSSSHCKSGDSTADDASSIK